VWDPVARAPAAVGDPRAGLAQRAAVLLALAGGGDLAEGRRAFVAAPTPTSPMHCVPTPSNAVAHSQPQSSAAQGAMVLAAEPGLP
jgi:hypothetical protein